MPGVIPSEELAVLLIRDEHWVGNIQDMYVEDGSENGRIKFTSQKWPHIQIYWTGQEWSIKGVFFQGGHTLGSDEYPKTQLGDRLHVKIVQAGHTMKHDGDSSGSNPLPTTSKSMGQGSMGHGQPSPKKPKHSDERTLERTEIHYESGKAEFLYNFPGDAEVGANMPPVVPGGQPFKWQNLGRLFWQESGEMWGSMGSDKLKDGFDFHGHIHTRSTDSDPADRKFILTRQGEDGKPDVIEGILPPKDVLANADLRHPTDFKMTVTMPPFFKNHVDVTCIIFKAEVHEEIRIEITKASDMDNSRNMFDK